MMKGSSLEANAQNMIPVLIAGINNDGTKVIEPLLTLIIHRNVLIKMTEKYERLYMIQILGLLLQFTTNRTHYKMSYDICLQRNVSQLRKIDELPETKEPKYITEGKYVGLE